MTPEYRMELRELCEKATPGPWEYESSGGQDCVWHDVMAAGEEILNGETQPQLSIVHASYHHQCRAEARQVNADLTFVASARTALPAALDDIDRLEAENKKLRDALEHADCEWCKSFGDLYPQIPECPDCKAARAALRREPE